MQSFVADDSPHAYERLIDRLLASPHYGERWGRHWLDVSGYADSNGYHRADTPRPLAYRYRDYVIRAFNDDKPYDRFWVEQLAGDELVSPDNLSRYTPEVVELLVATHFLRNAPDGTDSTEGNEIARTIERYAVLEQQLQITMTAMFGLTIDCARCHNHKFDPIPQSDYYALQAVFYPAFNVMNWVSPKDRTMHLAPPVEIARWEAASKECDRDIEQLAQGLSAWTAAHRPAGKVVFRDEFDETPAKLAGRWSNTAPGDDAPAGSIGVNIDSANAPGAQIVDRKLQIIEAGATSSGWLVTKDTFDWTPDREGDWIQATFELVADRLQLAATGAERIGYYVALHDYNGNSPVAGGNVLIDGNPAGGAAVEIDYPGLQAHNKGKIGTTEYRPGHHFGVRLTNIGNGQYRLEQLVDWIADKEFVTLEAADLPDGGFGFEYCCGRSFIVDSVSIETGDSSATAGGLGAYTEQLKVRREEFDKAVQAKKAACGKRPGEIAWATDLSDEPPVVPLLKRGRYSDPGEAVAAGAPGILCEPGNNLLAARPESEARTTGRRLAFARWATRPNSRARHCWPACRSIASGCGISVAVWSTAPKTSGRVDWTASHPELLEWLAARFVQSGWSTKALHREIMLSQAYRQGTDPSRAALAVDPENRLLWGYPVHRLESEAVRDAMLVAAGALNRQSGGPAVDYERTPDGQSFVTADASESSISNSRRSVYLRHRRSEPITFLQTFDQATAEPNCIRRSSATVVSQSLAMLNSRFANAVSGRFARRVAAEAGVAIADHVRLTFLIAYSREITKAELTESLGFVDSQTARYLAAGSADGIAAESALIDFCQALLASNEFLYVR